ncbi:MAG: hypothetical protein WD738_23175 [Pirellulales bacterium]
MPCRRYLLLTLAAGHLVVVVCGACCCLPDRSLGPAAQILRWYATMSGAGSNYGFFAPQVGAPHRVRFSLQDGQGSTSWDVFDEANNAEARLRLTGIVDYAFMAGTAAESPDWRKHLVRSWAAAMFTRHPTAVSLTAVVEAYDVPIMADYRAGSRPSWEVVYRAQVQRH